MTSPPTPRSGRSPAATGPGEVVVDSLIEMREQAVMLQTILQESGTPPSPAAGELMEGMMSHLSTALSALNTGAGAASSSAASGRRRRGPAGPQRRTGSSRRRSNSSPFCRTVTTNKLEDGNQWRKYGQKDIQDSPNNPRSYYRCTHKQDQGCKATRHVQASVANPSEYVINYFGEHSCRDPSTIPLVINDASPLDGENLISFGGGGARGTHAAEPITMFPRLFVGYSSSLPAAAPARSGSEGAVSSSSPAGYLTSMSVVGSAGMTSSATVGSAPAYWPDMDTGGGIGTGSLPSSPSSLAGFMTTSFGSFGNAGDDDLFGFDFDP